MTIMTFDEFWTLYPRKTAKIKAREKWDKIKPDDNICDLIRFNLRIRTSPGGEWYNYDKKFIPHPATYLHQERWDDEIISSRASLYDDLVCRDWIKH